MRFGFGRLDNLNTGHNWLFRSRSGKAARAIVFLWIGSLFAIVAFPQRRCADGEFGRGAELPDAAQRGSRPMTPCAPSLDQVEEQAETARRNAAEKAREAKARHEEFRAHLINLDRELHQLIVDDLNNTASRAQYKLVAKLMDRARNDGGWLK